MNPPRRSRQGDSSDQQDYQHHIWERGCKVNHLSKNNKHDTLTIAVTPKIGERANPALGFKQTLGYFYPEQQQLSPLRGCHGNIQGVRAHLAGGLDSLPDAEVANDPGNGQTDHQIPIQGANVIDTRGNPQHPASEAHASDAAVITPPYMSSPLEMLTPPPQNPKQGFSKCTTLDSSGGHEWSSVVFNLMCHAA